MGILDNFMSYFSQQKGIVNDHPHISSVEILSQRKVKSIIKKSPLFANINADTLFEDNNAFFEIAKKMKEENNSDPIFISLLLGISESLKNRSADIVYYNSLYSLLPQMESFFKYITLEMSDQDKESQKEECLLLLSNLLDVPVSYNEIDEKNDRSYRTSSIDYEKTNILLSSLFLSFINNRKDFDDYDYIVSREKSYTFEKNGFYQEVYNKLPVSEKDDFLKYIQNEKKVFFDFEFKESLTNEYIALLKNINENQNLTPRIKILSIYEKIANSSIILDVDVVKEIIEENIINPQSIYPILNQNFLKNYNIGDEKEQIEKYKTVSEYMINKYPYDSSIKYVNKLPDESFSVEKAKVFFEQALKIHNISYELNIIASEIMEKFSESDIRKISNEIPAAAKYFKEEIQKITKTDYYTMSDQTLSIVLKGLIFTQNKETSPISLNDKVKLLNEMFSPNRIFNGDILINKNKINMFFDYIPDDPDIANIVVRNLIEFNNNFFDNYNGGSSSSEDLEKKMSIYMCLEEHIKDYYFGDENSDREKEFLQLANDQKIGKSAGFLEIISKVERSVLLDGVKENNIDNIDNDIVKSSTKRKRL